MGRGEGHVERIQAFRSVYLGCERLARSRDSNHVRRGPQHRGRTLDRIRYGSDWRVAGGGVHLDRSGPGERERSHHLCAPGYQSRTERLRGFAMSTNPDDDMKPEYDFSRAQRGRHFAGTDAAFHIPVYLEQDVQTFLMEKAASKGVPDRKSTRLNSSHLGIS